MKMFYPSFICSVRIKHPKAINIQERTGLLNTKDIFFLKFFEKKVGFIWKFQKNAVPLHPHSRNMHP